MWTFWIGMPRAPGGVRRVCMHCQIELRDPNRDSWTTPVTLEHRHEAERFLAELQTRFAQLGLEPHPDKTCLIEFGRFADENGVPCNGPQRVAFRHEVRTTVVSHIAASQSEAPNAVEAHAALHRPLASIRESLPSLSFATSARHHPRQEPSAVVPLAGICAGGYGKPWFLLRHQWCHSRCFQSRSRTASEIESATRKRSFMK